MSTHPSGPGRLTASLILLLGTLSPAMAQTGTWTKQAPVPTAGNSWSLAVVSPTEIHAVARPTLGNAGEVVHTTDAGITWDVTPLDATANAVFFLDAGHGWLAGNAFRYTSDGGQTWTKANSWGSIYDLFFVDAQHGWACGNGSVAYRTTDGGLTWSGVTTPGQSTLSGIWFHDILEGWCVSISGRILHTSDGGVTWTLNHDAGEYLSTIQFLSPNEGWAVGGDTFLHTLDGGTTWNPVAVPVGTWSHGIHFTDSSTGISVGEAGNVVRTTSGGQSWHVVSPQGSGPRLYDVQFADATTAFYVGDSGAIFRSTDAGVSWEQIQNGAFGITRGMDVLDENTAWAANQGGEIQLTTDGGMNWRRVSVGGFDEFGDLHDISFADADHGWVAGENEWFGGSDGRISRTVDGGLTWFQQVNLPFVEFLGITALDDQRAIAYGRGNFASSAYLQTFDGGLNWSGGGPAASNGFRDAFFLDDGQTGWIVGNDIHRTLDGGQTWSLQHTGPGPQFSAISFFDANHGWAVGFQGIVVRTSDGGATWTPQDAGAPTGAALLGVTATGPNSAWVAGWQGYAARTEDGGATWQGGAIPGAANAYFECAAFTSHSSGWVAGDLGIFHWQAEDPCGDASTYCVAVPNSTGNSASISFQGSCEIGGGSLTLQASPVPAQPYLFFHGPAELLLPFGDGFRCVGGQIVRLDPAQPALNGVATRTLDLSSAGFVLGQVVHFQCWYRDPAAGGSGFNLSDGLRLVVH